MFEFSWLLLEMLPIYIIVSVKMLSIRVWLCPMFSTSYLIFMTMLNIFFNVSMSKKIKNEIGFQENYKNKKD